MARTGIFEAMERNENGKRRRRSVTPAAPSHWRSRMQRTIRQQAKELTQLHRTVGHLASLVEARAARLEAQRLAMPMWMQEREQKWDARYEDNKVWGAGITNMIAKTMKVVAQGLEEREREREMTARTDGGGLEASQHADTTREEGPEECQQPQQHPKPDPKLQLKLQPKPQPAVVGKRLPPLQSHAFEWVRDSVNVIAALHHAIDKVEKPSLDGIRSRDVPIIISSLSFVS
jgi:hypothetical protein